MTNKLNNVYYDLLGLLSHPKTDKQQQLQGHLGLGLVNKVFLAARVALLVIMSVCLIVSQSVKC